MSLADLLEELEAAKDSKKARSMEAYMRYQFSFLGIAVPERNKLYKIFSRSEKNKDYRLGFCRHLLGKGS
ncbi:putative DNA alkylation repair enzyme [Streptococcus pneumoniae]|nr:putative DNA alkylation repair enzyme [Streptococcus pneumoniae]VMC67932.1 putative DNA alkylation repair enzyme [Streptococcus pneumoniae]VRS21155.1 putative DNA alkylation repair enzyme [Streptococcus pneumoniae]